MAIASRKRCSFHRERRLVECHGSEERLGKGSMRPEMLFNSSLSPRGMGGASKGVKLPSGERRVELQLISGAFEHSVLRVREIYAWENAVFYIAVYGLYKLYISCAHNTECSNATEIN